MENCIKISGVIKFDPKNITNKHERQSEWKKVAMVILEPNLKGDEKGITEYYAWFIKKRFNLHLQKPIRNAHITFINDRESETNGRWEDVKNRWDGKIIDITLNVDPLLGVKNRDGDYVHWWLTVPNEFREELHSIRRELELSERPRFGIHMTIGRALNHYLSVEVKENAAKAISMFEQHSEYIIKLAQSDLI